MNPGRLKMYDLDYDSMSNVYQEIMNVIFTNKNVCEVIVKIVKAYPLTFIPINNLVTIINTWINDYFIGKFRILLVSHAGYTYYDLEGNKTEMTLQEACNIIKEGKVDVIPSTSSGFRALDFPNLKNILIFSGKIAGSLIQQVGRVSRQKEMNIISLSPEDEKKIPVYSKGTDERDKMINSYYRDCEINKIFIKECDLETLNSEN
jgi:ERCC4-related helicase